MDTKNFAIGVLSTTAVMLLVGLVVVHSRPESVMAEGTITAGDYMMTVGAITRVDEDMLYVIDNSEQKLIAYRFTTAKGIEVAQGIDLAEIRERADTAPTKEPPPKKRYP